MRNGQAHSLQGPVDTRQFVGNGLDRSAKKESLAALFFYLLKLSLRDTLRLNTMCSGELSRLSMQK